MGLADFALITLFVPDDGAAHLTVGYAGLMSVLARCGASVQDIEQIVIRGQIALGVVVEVPEGKDLLRDVLLWGWEEGIEVDFDVGRPGHGGQRYFSTSVLQYVCMARAHTTLHHFLSPATVNHARSAAEPR